MAGKTCQICGANSGIYPLCKTHLEMKAKDLVIKNEKTGKWEIKFDKINFNKQKEEKTLLWEIKENNGTDNIEYINETETCCVCGEHAPNGKQCKDCYYETLDYKDNIDKNRKANELREWYYNLKGSIYRTHNFNKKCSNCNKLIALAILCRDIHNDDSLISRVYKDIEDIMSKSNKIENEKQEEIKEEYDSHKNDTSGQVKCIDGHWVENDLEREIDDILYSLRKPHVYAKRVNEITSRTVKSDWFIPVLSDTKGIYIELWGMDTEDYKRNKEEKIKLYKEEELSLIEIYRKDVLSDKALLRDNLESQINEKEKELKRKR